MYRETVVPLPSLIMEDEDVKAWLEDNYDLWSAAIDRTVHHIDPRAEYLDYSIEQIDVENGQISIQYAVEYDLYYGCKDVDGAGEDCREIDGEVADGTVVFSTFVQPEPLAPDEEL